MNENLLNIIKEAMSGLLPVHKIKNIAPKIAERLEAKGIKLQEIGIYDSYTDTFRKGN